MAKAIFKSKNLLSKEELERCRLEFEKLLYMNGFVVIDDSWDVFIFDDYKENEEDEWWNTNTKKIIK